MENERTKNIFYLDLKHVHKYGCAKFQPNPLFSSQDMATESAAEEKKKSWQPHRGSRRGAGCPKYQTTIDLDANVMLVGGDVTDYMTPILHGTTNS